MRTALRAIAGFPPARVGYLNESIEVIRGATEFLIRAATEFLISGATECWIGYYIGIGGEATKCCLNKQAMLQDLED
jgi:hypothetical protein